MSFKEIKEKRQVGKLDEALQKIQKLKIERGVRNILEQHASVFEDKVGLFTNTYLFKGQTQRDASSTAHPHGSIRPGGAF